MDLVIILVCAFVAKSVCISVLTEEEPQCISRFDYDFKVLRKLVVLEQQYEELKEISIKQGEIIKHMSTDYGDNIDKLKTDTKHLLSAVSLEGTGSTYVRWGRTSCSENGTEMVYTGFAGGSHYSQSGAGSNYLCLPSDPLWEIYDDTVEDVAMVHGAEYQFFTNRAQKFFGEPFVNEDVPCAVCSSVRSRVVMIPGRNACYDGWTLEYSGYLTAGYHGHSSASEFVCLDEHPEKIQGGHASHDGKLFYMAEARCGSLKCPPYVNGRELTCAVCTK